MLNHPITLVRHHLDDGFRCGNYASWWSDGYESRAEMTRHHIGNCAPYWVLTEQHADSDGRYWHSGNRYCVMDGFGYLQEVTP